MIEKMTVVIKNKVPVRAVPVLSSLPQYKFSHIRKLTNQPGSLAASPLFIQPKLAIGNPDDAYEREADRVAETVMRMPEPVIQTTSFNRTEQVETTPDKSVGLIRMQQQTTPATAATQVTIQIDRDTETANSTLGTLSIGNLQFDTLELPDRNNASTGNSNTAGRIPAGTYTAHIRTDGTRGWRIELENVPGRTNIQIHVGNTPNDITGCALVGTSRGQDRVNGSVNARNQIQNEVQNAGQNVTIQVIVTDPAPATPAPQQTPVQPKLNDNTSNQVHFNKTAVDISPEMGISRKLPESTRSFFENRFGHDFSRVRIHTDAKAAESAQSINARAYTVGNDLVFNRGQYAPDTSAGRMLLGHELTHVVQQNKSTLQSSRNSQKRDIFLNASPLLEGNEGRFCDLLQMQKAPPPAEGKKTETESPEPKTAGKVCLTFDDGPNAGTKDVLDALGDIPVTFFFIGKKVEINQDLVSKIIQEKKHQIGTHTYEHLPLSNTQYKEEYGAIVDKKIKAEEKKKEAGKKVEEAGKKREEAEKKGEEAEKKLVEPEKKEEKPEKEVEKPEKKVEKAEKTIEQAEKEIEEAKKKIIEAGEKIVKIEKKILEAEKKAGKIEKKIEEAKAIIVEAKKIIEEAKTIIEQAKKQLEEAKKEIAEAEKELKEKLKPWIEKGEEPVKDLFKTQDVDLLFRPPGGAAMGTKMHKEIIAAIKSLGKTAVLWNYEFSYPKGTLGLKCEWDVKNVGVRCDKKDRPIKGPKSGHIVLLHDSHWKGHKDVLKSVLSTLSKTYKFTFGLLNKAGKCV